MSLFFQSSRAAEKESCFKSDFNAFGVFSFLFLLVTY